MHLNRILLEGAFARVARALTRQHQMDVRFRGAGAYVTDDHRTMSLPALDALDASRMNERQIEELRELVAAEEGFVDHECGHVRYTERGLVERYPWKRPADKTMWNVLEDARIERLMGEAFPGCRENIAYLNAWARRKGKTTLEHQAARCENGFGRICMAILDRLTFGTAWDALRVRDRDVALALDVVAPMIDAFAARMIAGTVTSRETADVATEVMDALMALEEAARRQREEARERERQADPAEKSEGTAGAEEPDGGETGDDDGPGEDSESDDADKPRGGKRDSGRDPEEDAETSDWPEEDGDEARGGGADGDAGSGSGGGEETGGGDGGATEVDGTPAGSGRDDAAADAEARECGEKLARGIHAGNWEVPDKQTTLARELTGMIRPDTAKGKEPLVYVPFSTEFDVEKMYAPADRAKHRDQYHADRHVVLPMVSTIMGVLESTLMAEAEDRWVGEQEDGPRFDRRMLGRLAAGQDVYDRARMQRVVGERINTAVSLLIDRSGSMGAATKNPGPNGLVDYSKSYVARLAALAFHEALASIEVPHEVLSFSTGSDARLVQAAAEATRRGEDVAAFARGTKGYTLLHDVYKSFEDEDAFPIVECSGRGANCDGESVLWAARRLAQREEPRKILIVFSDGQPSGVDTGYHKLECDYLADTVRRVTAAGVEVYAIGIAYEGVKLYYPNHVVVRTLADLPVVTVGLIQRMLLDQRRTGGHERI